MLRQFLAVRADAEFLQTARRRQQAAVDRAQPFPVIRRGGLESAADAGGMLDHRRRPLQQDPCRLHDLLLILRLLTEIDLDPGERDDGQKAGGADHGDAAPRRLGREFGIDFGDFLDGALVRQIHDVEDAPNVARFTGAAIIGENRIAVFPPGKRLQMRAHGALELLADGRLRGLVVGCRELEQEFRCLAIDHEHRVEGQEDHGVGPHPAAVVAFEGLLNQEVPPGFEAEGFKAVLQADFGELPGASGAGERLLHGFDQRVVTAHPVVQGDDRIGDGLELLEEFRRRLLHLFLGFLFGGVGLALMVFEQLVGEFRGTRRQGGVGAVHELFLCLFPIRQLGVLKLDFLLLDLDLGEKILFGFPQAVSLRGGVLELPADFAQAGFRVGAGMGGLRGGGPQRFGLRPQGEEFRLRARRGIAGCLRAECKSHGGAERGGCGDDGDQQGCIHRRDRFSSGLDGAWHETYLREVSNRFVAFCPWQSSPSSPRPTND